MQTNRKTDIDKYTQTDRQREIKKHIYIERERKRETERDT